MEKLKKQIDHNYKCERNVYGKMFFNRGNAESSKTTDEESTTQEATQSKTAELSVSDYVEKKQVKINPWKTVEDQEVEDELKKIESEVTQLLVNKECELSFEVKQVGDRDYASFPEIEQLESQIEICIQNYRMCRKMHKKDEQDFLRSKIKEMKFAKEHLKKTMNLDFTKPTGKMKALAEQKNIDLNSVQVLEEFKVVQMQNLEDVRRLRDGKPPLTEAELKKQRANLLRQL
jgi:hypothetical protein